MSRFLQFWCKLNTHEDVKNCPFCFLRDYYGDSLDVMFPQFPNHSLPFRMVFPHVSPSVLRFPRVFLQFSLSVFRVSYFIFCAENKLEPERRRSLNCVHEEINSHDIFCVYLIRKLMVIYQGNISNNEISPNEVL